MAIGQEIYCHVPWVGRWNDEQREQIIDKAAQQFDALEGRAAKYGAHKVLSTQGVDRFQGKVLVLAKVVG